MRKLITILFICFLQNVFAVSPTYYVSNSGNDANNGTSPSTSWQTIAKVNATTFNPGDNILFKSGDVWYGELIISHSGSFGNPITYGSYSTGAKPVITGFTNITSFSNLGGNIWESSSAVSTLSNCNMVMIGGSPVAMGRFPNTGYFPYQSNNGTTSFTSSSLDGVINWTGALVSMKRERWYIETDTITSQSGSTLNFTTLGRYPLDINGTGFFIQNDPRTLDQQNEWYYNASTGKLRIYSSSSPVNVQIATLQNVIQDSSNSAYITINGLSLIGANQAVIDGNFGQYITITNCDVKYGGTAGIVLNGQNPTVTNNTVDWNLYTGINSQQNGVDGVFSYNTVTNTCLIPGTQERGGGSAMYLVAKRGMIQYNIVDSTGWGGILVYGDTATAQYNYINYSCLVRDDGGGLATHGGYSGVKFINNIILNSQGNTDGEAPSLSTAYAGHGIYLDDLSDNVTVIGNTMAGNRGVGLFLHRNTNNTIYGNTIYNNGNNTSTFARGQIFFQYSDNPLITNMTIKKNIVFATNSNEITLRFYSSPANTNFPSSIGSLDSNVYVNISGADANAFSIYNNPTTLSKNLAAWQTYTGQDTHSVDSTSAVTDQSKTILVVNPTSSNSTVSLPYICKDLYGNIYNGSITLAPFTSAVLIKNGILPITNALILYGNYKFITN